MTVWQRVYILGNHVSPLIWLATRSWHAHIEGPHKDVTHVPHFLLHSDRVAVDGGSTCLVQAGGVFYLPSDGTRKHEHRGGGGGGLNFFIGGGLNLKKMFLGQKKNL